MSNSSLLRPRLTRRPHLRLSASSQLASLDDPTGGLGGAWVMSPGAYQ
jgi:hypothetical protein